MSDPLAASWITNADAWTSAVREGLIPSRRAGTDAAIIAVCQSHQPSSVLDVGCGEGWLARALAGPQVQVLGIDGSPPLIRTARASGGAEFDVVSYAALQAEPSAAAGPWDLIVCNFALLGDPLSPILRALATRLAPGGHLIIQTVHPLMAAGEGPYINGWRTETFAAFSIPFPAHMPWYFRTLGSWIAECALAGLTLRAMHEPLHPESHRPLSLILELGHQPNIAG